MRAISHEVMKMMKILDNISTGVAGLTFSEGSLDEEVLAGPEVLEGAFPEEPGCAAKKVLWWTERTNEGRNEGKTE